MASWNEQINRFMRQKVSSDSREAQERIRAQAGISGGTAAGQGLDVTSILGGVDKSQLESVMTKAVASLFEVLTSSITDVASKAVKEIQGQVNRTVAASGTAMGGGTPAQRAVTVSPSAPGLPGLTSASRGPGFPAGPLAGGTAQAPAGTALQPSLFAAQQQPLLRMAGYGAQTLSGGTLGTYTPLINAPTAFNSQNVLQQQMAKLYGQPQPGMGGSAPAGLPLGAAPNIPATAPSTAPNYQTTASYFPGANSQAWLQNQWSIAQQQSQPGSGAPSRWAQFLNWARPQPPAGGGGGSGGSGGSGGGSSSAGGAGGGGFRVPGSVGGFRQLLGADAFGRGMNMMLSGIQGNQQASLSAYMLQQQTDAMGYGGSMDGGPTAYAQRLRDIGRPYGYTAQESINAVSPYLLAAAPSMRNYKQPTGPYQTDGGALAQLGQFASGTGLDLGQYMQTAAGFAQTGVIGGGQGSMGIGNFQGALAATMAASSGLAKPHEYMQGLQDIIRQVQTQTITTPNILGTPVAGQPGQYTNSLLGLYASMNRLNIPGASGVQGAQLLGQVNQGMLTGATGGAGMGVNMAYYLAAGGNAGISPARLQYEAEEGVSGPLLGQVLKWGKRTFGNRGEMNRWNAESKVLGISMHQTDIIEKASRGSTLNLSRMQQLVKGSGSDLGTLNETSVLAIGDIAAGKKSLGAIATAAVQGGVKKDDLKEFLHISGKGTAKQQQDLTTALVHAGTIKTPAAEERDAMNALTNAIQGLDKNLDPVYKWAQTQAGGFGGAIIPGAAALGGNALGNLLGSGIGKLLGGRTITGVAGGVGSKLAGGVLGGIGDVIGAVAGSGAVIGGGILLAGALAGGLAGKALTKLTDDDSYARYKSSIDAFLKSPAGKGFQVKGDLFGGLNVTDGKTSIPVKSWGEVHRVHNKNFKDKYVLQTTGNIFSPGQDYLLGAATVGGGGHGVEVAHTKAATDKVNDLVSKVLNPKAPLLSSTERQLDTDLKTFLKKYGDNLTDWQRAALDKIAGSAVDTGSAAGSDSGAYSGDAFRSNTLGGYSVASAQGRDISGAGLKFGSYRDTREVGPVFNVGAGKPVKLPEGGRYDAAHSTDYNSVFITPEGQAVSFLHLKARKFSNNQFVSAGTVVGTGLASGGTYSGKTSTGSTWTGGMTGGGLVEMDVFNAAQGHSAAEQAFARPESGHGTGEVNVMQWLAKHQGHGMTTGGGGTGYPSSVSIVDSSGKRQTLRDKRLIKDYVDASKKWGVPLSVLVAQGYQESGWSASAVNSKQGVRTNAGIEHAQGIAQFIPSTAKGFNIDPFNPDQAINAQAHYMNQLGATTPGGVLTALQHYGTGDITGLINTFQQSSPAGGGHGIPVSHPSHPHNAKASQKQAITIGNITVEITLPNGTVEKIQGAKVKFDGVAGLHVMTGQNKQIAQHRKPQRR